MHILYLFAFWRLWHPSVNNVSCIFKMRNANSPRKEVSFPRIIWQHPRNSMGTDHALACGEKYCRKYNSWGKPSVIASLLIFSIPNQIKHFYTCFSRLHEESEEDHWCHSVEWLCWSNQKVLRRLEGKKEVRTLRFVRTSRLMNTPQLETVSWQHTVLE